MAVPWAAPVALEAGRVRPALCGPTARLGGPPGASLNASLKPGLGVVGAASPGHAPLQVPLRGTCGPDVPTTRTNESSTNSNGPPAPCPSRSTHRARPLLSDAKVLIVGEEPADASPSPQPTWPHDPPLGQTSASTRSPTTTALVVHINLAT